MSWSGEVKVWLGARVYVRQCLRRCFGDNVNTLAAIYAPARNLALTVKSQSRASTSCGIYKYIKIYK